MATINKTFIPVEAIHPTELIKDELQARGMQKQELAERLGMKPSNLSRFLRTKENITSQMALKLQEALGISAEYWMKLQLDYDRDIDSIRHRNEEETKAAQIEKVLSSMLNLPFLWKRLELDGYKFLQERIMALYRMLGISNMEDLLMMLNTQGCFKKSENLRSEEKNLCTWILLAKHACLCERKNVVSNYLKGNESIAARIIAARANAQNISEEVIKTILSENGIGYCVVNKFEKTPVDAYSTIIEGRPFIVTSHRRNNMDMLVFDILHECGHIHKHLTEGSAFVSYNQDLGNAIGIEQEANEYARDMLISPAIWANIIKGKSKSLSAYSLIKTIVAEANKNGISPTIAAWRFKFETGEYKIPGYKSRPIT